MYRDKETCLQLHHEAVRCRMAFETFLFLLEQYFVRPESKRESDWFLIQDRYISWLAHLFEVLQLCMARDMELDFSKLSCSLVRKGFIENKREASAVIDRYLDGCSKQAVELEGPCLDIAVQWNEGFGQLVRHIRNKHYAHPDKQRLVLNKLVDFTENHYFTAFCSYKFCVLYWARLDDFPLESVHMLERFKKALLKISESSQLIQDSPSGES